jgi:hypothetical protein
MRPCSPPHRGRQSAHLSKGRSPASGVSHSPRIQLDPVVRAIRMPRVNLLIADDELAKA